MSAILKQLDKDISRLKEQQAKAEGRITTTPDPIIQTQLQQAIDDLKEEIARKRRKYFEELADLADALTVEEPEAEVITAEIVEAVSQIEQQPADASEEMLVILQEIRDKLNKPGATAAAKLKGIISSFPPFVGVTYEAELDTEQFLRKYFPTFRKWYLTAAKKP